MPMQPTRYEHELDELRAQLEASYETHGAMLQAHQETIAQRDELLAALRGIFKERWGCPMCDAGVLRNPAKPHWPECPYAKAEAALAKAEGGRTERTGPNANSWTCPDCNRVNPRGFVSCGACGAISPPWLPYVQHTEGQ